MSLCASCKNKTSDEQCSATALRGLLFCGKHAKVKEPRVWATVNNVDRNVIQIQKLWRGYRLRNWIKLAGPGVLCRTLCHNDEELVTLESKNEIRPMNYFSFEESGKIWWFDIRSIHRLMADTTKPKNPYTRQFLTLDTRRRARQLFYVRKKHDLPLEHMDPPFAMEMETAANWVEVCQIIEENGFEECVNPILFASMHKAQYVMFLHFLNIELTDWNPKSKSPLRTRYLMWTKRTIQNCSTCNNYLEVSYLSSRNILTLLYGLKTPFPICYMIMKALYKL